MLTDNDPLFDDDDDEDPPPDRRLTTSEQKLQRWVDLLAALLVRQRYAPFDELAKDIPGYDIANAQHDSVMRTFERDKDELRRFGVPIETVKDGDSDTLGYRLDRKAFYLPYLMVSSHERAAHGPKRVDHDGYRALQTLAFEPDELDAIIEAAARVRALGDPTLAREAEAAIRKLALDLPLGAVLQDMVSPTAAEKRTVKLQRMEQPAEPEAALFSRSLRAMIVPPRRQADPSVFDRVGDALARRKVVTFDYHAMERDERSRRTVQPYGLFFVSSHWYLAGRDTDRDALRNFRLSRISNVEVNLKKSQSADYEIPTDFSLRNHAQAREPWEIGDGDATAAIVEFTATTGATQAARRLGRPVDGSEDRREFDVRRPDAFARWLLSFGGDARPIEPAEIREAYASAAAATLGRYAGATPDE
ncbi:MAG TPA: WYL domain-containing protein [Gemmatimonadaceae bacterium]|nr:WYL domain-containing protein [Gemmatimonadaceae bacterium]